MKLDKHSSVPLYYQLKEYILEKIETGEYEPGSKIPSEMIFCEKHDLSRPTVRQAISELVAEGQLQIVKGKGTFVSSIGDRIELKGFSGNSFSFLNQQSMNKKEIDDYTIIKNPDPEIERAFEQTSYQQDGYLCIKRTLTHKDGVFAYTESYIPVVLFPNLADDIRNERSMVDITANKYAYLPAKSSCKVMVRPANSTEARALEISRGTPVLYSFSKLTSRSGAICEVTVTSMRSDICRLSLS